MMTGAFAYGVYGIPRSTMDVDLVLSVAQTGMIKKVIQRLGAEVEFDCV